MERQLPTAHGACVCVCALAHACVCTRVHACASCTACVARACICAVCICCIRVHGVCACPVRNVCTRVCLCGACTGTCICARADACAWCDVYAVCTNAHVCACARVCVVCVMCVHVCGMFPCSLETMVRSSVVTWSQAGGSLCPSDAGESPGSEPGAPTPSHLPTSGGRAPGIPPHICTSRGPTPCPVTPIFTLARHPAGGPALPPELGALGGVPVPCSVRKARLWGLIGTLPASWVASGKLLHLSEPPFPPHRWGQQSLPPGHTDRV